MKIIFLFEAFIFTWLKNVSEIKNTWHLFNSTNKNHSVREEEKEDKKFSNNKTK